MSKEMNFIEKAASETKNKKLDGCNHRNQKGEYLFEINDDLTVTCTKCGKTFTRRFAR